MRSNIILVNTCEGVVCKYTDFYVAKETCDATEIMRTRLIVSEYTAPEIIFQETYTNLVDVW
jgi:serine/threonine protein kinase